MSPIFSAISTSTTTTTEPIVWLPVIAFVIVALAIGKATGLL